MAMRNAALAWWRYGCGAVTFGAVVRVCGGDWSVVGPRYGLGAPVSCAEWARRIGRGRMVVAAREMLAYVAMHPELLTPAGDLRKRTGARPAVMAAAASADSTGSPVDFGVTVR